MLLSNLFNPHDLAHELEAGYVRMRSHPQDAGLFILNYTEKAQYEKHWTDVTRACRGLIAQTTPDGEDALVVARPWPKFFNYGEIGLPYHEPVTLGKIMDHPAVAQDKMDGSLGILYCDPEMQWSIATRGSFESDQAKHATEVWRRFYEDYWAPRPGYTYLFEIVYPDNRIVLNYGTTDDLFLLDILENETGRSVLLFGEKTNHGFPGRTTGQFFTSSLHEALQMKDRPNAEGFVVTFGPGNADDEPNLKVKIKQEDYVALHKLVTGLNERVVWEHLSTGAALEALLADVPDEFHSWVREVGGNLQERYEILHGRAHTAHLDCLDALEEVVDSWGPGVKPVAEWERMERAAFAQIAKRKADLTPFMFALYDGRDISAAIWKTLKPRGETKSLLNRSEDNS